MSAATKLVSSLVKCGVLSERIYGNQSEAEDDTVPASAAKIDPAAPQSTPGSEALATATADATPSPNDDADPEDPNAAPVVDASPVEFLLMSLMASGGMAEALEAMMGAVAAKYGDTAVPVMNDVIFKVKSARDQLQELVGSADEVSDEPEEPTDDEMANDAATNGPAADAAPGAVASPEG